MPVGDTASAIEQVPNIHHPQGTLAELEALGIRGDKLRGTLSCSEGNEKSAGCKFRNSCPFPGIAGVSGPILLAVRRVNEDDQGGENLKSCYAYMQVDHDLSMAGGPIEIAAIEPGHDSPLNELGHTYLARGTVKRHEKKVADCPGCKRGDCALADEFIEERPIPNFVRPGRVLSGELGNQKMRERMRAQMAHRAVARRMGVEDGLTQRVAPRPRKGQSAGSSPAEDSGS